MNFESWMRDENLSKATILKYINAINGPLTTWCNEAGFYKGSVASITDSIVFTKLMQKLNSEPVFTKRNRTGHNMYSSAMRKYLSYLTEQETSFERDISIICTDQCLSKSERSSLVQTRIGQGKFREQLIEYWDGKCVLTGYEGTSILVASHIKPWCVSSNTERTDKYNGLLLVPTFDKVFDKGLISFLADGSIIISEFLEDPSSLGIRSSMSIKLSQNHFEYMEYHRQHVFLR